MEQLFTDVILEELPVRSICFRSGELVYEEALVDGVYMAAGSNSAGFALAANPLPAPKRLHAGDFALPQAFLLELDGALLGYDWEWAGMERRDTAEGIETTVTLEDSFAQAEVRVHTQLDGTRVLTRWLEVVNRSDRPRNLSRLCILGGGLQTVRQWRNYLQDGESLYRLGYMEHSHHLMEGGFRWHDLPAAEYAVSGRFRRDRHRHPMFILQNRGTGEQVICQLGWSGGYRFCFDWNAEVGETAQHNDAHLAYGVELDAPAPMRVLEPGETVVTPKVHLGILFGDLDDAVNEMHTHLRRSAFLPPARGRQCWIEAGIGPEYRMSREATLESIENAATIGAEIFFIDAGWYLPPQEEEQWWSKAGDWTYDRQRYPNGLDEIRAQVKGRGMLFGLWMDAERIGLDSRAYTEHRELLSTTYDGRENRANLLRLSDPRAARWMEEQIARVIEENGCDFYRLDFNVGHGDLQTCTRRGAVRENDCLRYHEALYGVYQRLRRRFPQVVFENCAGGGGRTDVGLTSLFDHTWVTDWQLAPRSFAITNGMTMALPPERVDRLFGGQGGYLRGSLDFQLRLLLFVRPSGGISTPPGQRNNTGQLAFIRHCYGLYKDFIRPFLPTARIYHHTPEAHGIQPRGFGILEAAAPDGARGMLGVFQLADPGGRETTVRLRGVDVGRTYRLTFDNRRQCCRVAGYALANDGVHIRLEGALTSELVLYEAE